MSELSLASMSLQASELKLTYKFAANFVDQDCSCFEIAVVCLEDVAGHQQEVWRHFAEREAFHR